MKPKTILLAVVAIAVVALCALFPTQTLELVAIGSTGLVGMATHLRDQQLENAIALPTGASAVNSAGIDTQNGTSGDFVAGCEIEIEAPALTTGQLPDAQTITYKVQHDTDSAFGSATTLFDAVISQVGAGGAGAAAATVRHKLPKDVKRYVRLVATKVGAADASAKSATVRLVF